MKWQHLFALGFCWLLVVTPCHGIERVEIVLDASTEMWQSFADGTPRIVAARAAINSFIVSPAIGERGMEVGLRTIGGRSEISEDTGCGDSETLVASGPADPWQWFAALDRLDPRGGRALVHAVEEAAETLSGMEGDGRIVVLTSGADQCHRDLDALVLELSQAEKPIAVRIIGLGIDQEQASSMTLSTPTRNVNDPAKVLDTVRWGVLLSGTDPSRPAWLELHFTDGKTPLNGATFHVVDPYDGEEKSLTIEDGTVRVRLAPGRYRARVEGPDFPMVELADIVHLGSHKTVEVAISRAPPVTLEVDPEGPLAGDEAHIQYWGAPPGSNMVAVAVAGAPAGEYLVWSPAIGSAGEASLTLPESPNELELQFIHEIGSGIRQLLARVSFTTGHRRVSIDAPERVENRTPLSMTWSGTGLPGDYIAIAASGAAPDENVLCIPVVGAGPVTVNAPELAGEYVVHYLSRRGQPLARTNLEVFEILATLEGPAEIAPGAEFTVVWTGPEAAQDFLSIATVDESADQYLSFTPVTNGNPAILVAPVTPGDYELRYVRDSDSEILARQPVAVVALEITLDVPASVEAGTRFEVGWNGTAGEGDFIAVAYPRAGKKKHLDWSYTNLGSPVTLAAPFDPGTYVVRYISGTSQMIIARKSIEVR